jgi:hypothetical protein
MADTRNQLMVHAADRRPPPLPPTTTELHHGDVSATYHCDHPAFIVMVNMANAQLCADWLCPAKPHRKKSDGYTKYSMAQYRIA